jgi:hypothetical protein
MKKTTKKATETKKPAANKKAASAASREAAKVTEGVDALNPAKNGKGATILALIAREGGATAAELQQATGWQAHSVRGFLNTASKKGRVQNRSAKREDGQRVYSAQSLIAARARHGCRRDKPYRLFSLWR